MEWKFDNIKNEWNLYSENENLIKLKIITKSTNSIYKYKVKTYFSLFIVSKKYSKKNISWLKKFVRKFKDEKSLEKYINKKKLSYIKFANSLF